MATDNYLTLLSELELTPDEKNNSIRIKGFRNFQSFQSKGEKLKDNLIARLIAGEVSVHEAEQVLEKFKRGFKNYIFQNRTYRIHISFKFKLAQARFVVNVIHYYHPILNFNKEIGDVCDTLKLESFQNLSSHSGESQSKKSSPAKPLIHLNINAKNFFEFFNTLSQFKYDGKPILKFENKAELARLFSEIFEDRDGQRITSRTIETYLSKKHEKKVGVKEPPFLQLNVLDTLENGKSAPTATDK